MKLIVLDRDGVINQDSDNFVKSLAEFIPLPGSLQAIADLNTAGYTIAVATNQSGIARGYYGEETLAAMHAQLARWLIEHGGRVDHIEYCPHGPDDGCDCRKPKDGMMRAIADHYGLADLAGVPVVGDSLRDLEAGRALGATPFLVRTGKGERTLAKGQGLAGVQVFDDLAHFARWLLAEA